MRDIKTGDVFKSEYPSFYCIGVVTKVRLDHMYFSASEARYTYDHQLVAFDTESGYRQDQKGLIWLVGTDVENNLEKIPTGS